jgi:hypothetical protein
MDWDTTMNALRGGAPIGSAVLSGLFAKQQNPGQVAATAPAPTGLPTAQPTPQQPQQNMLNPAAFQQGVQQQAQPAQVDPNLINAGMQKPQQKQQGGGVFGHLLQAFGG